ncbi:MAG: hypothetical protein WC897_05860 [Candidatus Gracilibacteria bacterium]
MSKAKEQWEEEAIERFRNFLGQERATTYAVTGRDVVVNPATNENFDYQLQTQDGAKTAVEIFRLIESGEELARQKVFGSFIQELKKELLTRGVKGYLISTPEFVMKKRDISAHSTRLADEIEQAVKSNSEAEKFEYAGFEFSKIKDLETVVFSYHSGARSIDPRGTAATVFAGKLPKKNQQVAVSDHERILLVVSWAMFVDGADAIRALSGFDFSEFQNVDKIFFEPREGQFVLVYDRTVVEAIQNKQPLNDSPSLKLMLQYARYQLGEKKPEAFEYVKAVTTLTGSINWLADNGAKENLVLYGEELLAKDLIDDAMWIIRQLHDDDNPKPDGTNDVDDPKGEHNYHARVLRGEDANIITTVRGHLCWLLMKMVAKNQPQYYTEIIGIMSRYLKEDNLYIRIQASYIIDELWRRRRARHNQDESVFSWKDEERAYIRELALDTVRANRSYPRVMQALLHVFNSVRDLNEGEAEEILNLFLATKNDDVLHDLAAFVVYFALFREKDSQYYGGQFNPNKFVALLKEQIKNGDSSMRGSLAWHLWKLLTDKILPYEAIKEYLPLFLEGKYASEAMSKLALIFEELSKIAPDDAVVLYERALESLEVYLKTKPEDGYQNWINGTEEMLPILAKESKRLITVIGRLKNIWMMRTQIYIGNIQTIFGSYELVSSEHKEEVRTTLKVMYDEMKSVYPPLQKVDWTK